MKNNKPQGFKPVRSKKNDIIVLIDLEQFELNMANSYKTVSLSFLRCHLSTTFVEQELWHLLFLNVQPCATVLKRSK